MTFSKNIYNTVLIAAIVLIASVRSHAQAANAVYYVCAEQGFRLTGPPGYDHYAWSEGNTGIPGADSNKLIVQALGATAVGNSYVTKTYHLKVMNNNSCWSNEGTYVVHFLPKMQLSITGYTPPYCEHLSHDITLTAKINGGTGTSALTLPSGVGVAYSWTVDQVGGMGSLGNAGILGPADQEQAQVMTPQDATIDNNYNVHVEYSYPPTVNAISDIVGSCDDNLTQNVHADPAPPVPTINYESI